MKFADLHLHTVFSDGTYTPQELVAESARARLSAIAITDHDTVDGIPAAAAAAEKENIELLPGIELTVEYMGIEIHILAYLIDYKSPCLLEKLKTLKINRIERIYKITDKLKNMGVTLKPEAV
ncbi:MAG: PHP domain-containing protein, partial [Candidatus Omnitrophota bacterium]|nr:PHP domain-containing protein [Candidatus Omnitrophota bacterium]